jgi:hypothetical protein
MSWKRQTAAKDLSLVSFIPKWAGTEKSLSVNEFFEIIDSTANIGKWNEKVDMTTQWLNATIFNQTSIFTYIRQLELEEIYKKKRREYYPDLLWKKILTKHV